MKGYLLLLLIALLVGCNRKEVQPELNQRNNASKDVLEDTPEIIVPEILWTTPERIMKYLTVLCQSPRERGSEGEQLTSTYLQEQLEGYGYEVATQTFDVYRQTLESEFKQGYFNLNPYNEEAQCQATNIVARKEAIEPTAETLVISAHYDTISKSLGIWDNGSGTCVVLETARLLKDISLPFNIEFVFFSSEEYYLTGSKYYLTQLDDIQKNNIIGCINVDMVGDGNTEDVIIGTNYGLMNSLALRMNYLVDEAYKLAIARDIGMSDNFSFFKAGIPSVLISDSNIDFEKWVTPDDPHAMPLEAINTHKVVDVVDRLVNMIVSMDMEIDFNSGQTIRTVSLENLDERKIKTYIEEVEKGLEGYELVNIQEQLLPNGLDSSLVYTFKSDKENTYQITQVACNSIPDINLETFDNVKDRVWLKQDNNKTRLMIDTYSFYVYITGDFNQEQIDQLINIFE